MDLRVSRRIGAVVPLALLFAGCDLSLGHLAARASDDWTRTYPLSPSGELRIVNTNGSVDIEGVDGSTVEVRAERIARGATEAAARELLPRIVIKEESRLDRVSLQTERISGIMIGAAFEVRYHVRAPSNAAINVTTTNGQVAVTSLGGRVIAHTTNGGVRGKNLTGGVEARSTNGGVTIDLMSVGTEPVSLRTTNGGVTLVVPEKARANISASWTNGGINVSALEHLEVAEKSRRHFEGTLNGGGTPIELHTTNGGIRVRQHDSVADTRDTDERKDR